MKEQKDEYFFPNKDNSNTIQLIIDKIKLNIGNIPFKGVEGEIIDEKKQKLFFLKKIFQQPEYSRIIVQSYLYKILTENKLHKVKYIKEKDKKHIGLYVEGDSEDIIFINKITTEQFKKLLSQCHNDSNDILTMNNENKGQLKQFNTVEEGIIKNLMLFFNSDNIMINNYAIDYFVTLILGNKGTKNLTEENKKDLINYIFDYFDEKTEIIEYIDPKDM